MDLPKQFEVPPDLKESFQQQLLQQDFVAGRTVTCGVLRVHAKPSARAPQHLDLLLEELGPMPEAADGLVLEDLPSSIEDAGGLGGQYDEDDDEEDAAGGDVREIFDELRGAAPLLSLENLLAWADLQDMLAEGAVSQRDVDAALAGAGARPGAALSLAQFEDVLDALRDVVVRHYSSPVHIPLDPALLTDFRLID